MAAEKLGRVVSNSMQSTIIVAVDARVKHKRYKKVLTRTKRYAVHNKELDLKIGDKVTIRTIKPISKTKKWELVNLLEKPAT
mgnify:CR=1 FL=1